MKFLSLLFLPFLLFSLSQCNPLSADGDDEDRDERGDRRDDRDDRYGGIEFSEEGEKFLEGCSNYANHVDISPVEPFSDIRACLAKAIDDGLRPLCEQEKDLKEQLRRAERQGDDTRAEDIQADLEALEEDKYAIADDLYAIADSFDEAANAGRDSIDNTVDEAIDDEDDEADIFKWRLIGAFTNIAITVELDGFTRLVDRRARKACPSINLSRVRSRRNPR